MKVPVFIETTAKHFIGNVEIDSPDQFENASKKLWEENWYGPPILCNQCRGVELDDWYIKEENNLDFYFKKDK